MKQLAKILLTISLLSTLAWGYSDKVFEVQTVLEQLGYNTGTPDGVMGKNTRRAVRKFQREMGLPVTGRIDAELEGSLGIGMTEIVSAPVEVVQTAPTTQHVDVEESWFSNPFKGMSLGGFHTGSSAYRVGLVTAVPSFGFGFKADYSDVISYELIANPLGSFSTYLAKVDYYLTKSPAFNSYAFAGGGFGRYDYSVTADSGTETVGIFTLGGGLEWNWRQYLGTNIPDLSSTLELGYAHIPFDYWDFNDILVGASLYYRF